MRRNDLPGPNGVHQNTTLCLFYHKLKEIQNNATIPNHIGMEPWRYLHLLGMT